MQSSRTEKMASYPGGVIPTAPPKEGEGVTRLYPNAPPEKSTSPTSVTGRMDGNRKVQQIKGAASDNPPLMATVVSSMGQAQGVRATATDKEVLSILRMSNQEMLNLLKNETIHRRMIKASEGHVYLKITFKGEVIGFHLPNKKHLPSYGGFTITNKGPFHEHCEKARDQFYVTRFTTKATYEAKLEVFKKCILKEMHHLADDLKKITSTVFTSDLDLSVDGSAPDHIMKRYFEQYRIKSGNTVEYPSFVKMEKEEKDRIRSLYSKGAAGGGAEVSPMGSGGGSSRSPQAKMTLTPTAPPADTAQYATFGIEFEEEEDEEGDTLGEIASTSPKGAAAEGPASIPVRSQGLSAYKTSFSGPLRFRTEEAAKEELRKYANYQEQELTSRYPKLSLVEIKQNIWDAFEALLRLGDPTHLELKDLLLTGNTITLVFKDFVRDRFCPYTLMDLSKGYQLKLGRNVDICRAIFEDRVTPTWPNPEGWTKPWGTINFNLTTRNPRELDEELCRRFQEVTQAKKTFTPFTQAPVPPSAPPLDLKAKGLSNKGGQYNAETGRDLLVRYSGKTAEEIREQFPDLKPSMLLLMLSKALEAMYYKNDKYAKKPILDLRGITLIHPVALTALRHFLVNDFFPNTEREGELIHTLHLGMNHTILQQIADQIKNGIPSDDKKVWIANMGKVKIKESSNAREILDDGTLLGIAGRGVNIYLGKDTDPEDLERLRNLSCREGAFTDTKKKKKQEERRIIL